MCLTVMRVLPAFLLAIVLLETPPATYADEQPKPNRDRKPHRTTAQRLDLYSPRVRRSTLMYLRLRLLELREQGLDRARAAVERRLTVDELIDGPAGAPALRTPPPR